MPDSSPLDILAELEQDQVTFDWELLASTLKVTLSQVFEAASLLFFKHIGRPLQLSEEPPVGSLVPRHESLGRPPSSSLDLPASTEDFDRAQGLRSVESLNQSNTTEEGNSQPTDGIAHNTAEDGMRESLIADAMSSHVHHEQPHQEKSIGSSFSDLSSNCSLTESAMQEAMISEAIGNSTAMSSLLGASRMFPWSRNKNKKKKEKKIKLL